MVLIRLNLIPLLFISLAVLFGDVSADRNDGKNFAVCTFPSCLSPKLASEQGVIDFHLCAPGRALVSVNPSSWLYSEIWKGGGDEMNGEILAWYLNRKAHKCDKGFTAKCWVSLTGLCTSGPSSTAAGKESKMMAPAAKLNNVVRRDEAGTSDDELIQLPDSSFGH